jgi:4-hydroxybenzoate polyprenyltransferase
MLRGLLQAMRPHQWTKNLLVFAALLFTRYVTDHAAWTAAVGAFATFCLAASAIYLLNDIVDREHDRHHPKKRNRPIASGALPVPAAAAACVGLLVLAAALTMWVGSHQFEPPPEETRPRVPFFAWPLAYLALNLAYTFWLKHIVVVDCMCVALGFQIRIHAGATAIQVTTSHWIVLCTFFFALFLAFCKRYEELGRQTQASGHTRPTMREYTLPFLNMLIGPLAALSILTYALYTVSPETMLRHHTDNLMFTVPVVTYGVFRYLFLVYRREEGGDPSRILFRDPPLLVSGLLYVLLVLLVLRTAS